MSDCNNSVVVTVTVRVPHHSVDDYDDWFDLWHGFGSASEAEYATVWWAMAIASALVTFLAVVSLLCPWKPYRRWWARQLSLCPLMGRCIVRMGPATPDRLSTGGGGPPEPAFTSTPVRQHQPQSKVALSVTPLYSRSTAAAVEAKEQRSRRSRPPPLQRMGLEQEEPQGSCERLRQRHEVTSGSGRTAVHIITSTPMSHIYIYPSGSSSSSDSSGGLKIYRLRNDGEWTLTPPSETGSDLAPRAQQPPEPAEPSARLLTMRPQLALPTPGAVSCGYFTPLPDARRADGGIRAETPPRMAAVDTSATSTSHGDGTIIITVETPNRGGVRVGGGSGERAAARRRAEEAPSFVVTIDAPPGAVEGVRSVAEAPADALTSAATQRPCDGRGDGNLQRATAN